MDLSINKNIAELFEEIADLLELNDENPFKISAFRNSSRIITNFQVPVTQLLETGELKSIKGIGKASIEKITEYLETGAISYHNELIQAVPDGIFDILRIKGLGPKKAKKLWKELEITNIGELEYACKENRLILLSGFGEKTQKSVLENIIYLKQNRDKHLAGFFNFELEKFNSFLENDKVFKLFSPIGITRRASETYESIEYLFGDSMEKLKNPLKKYFPKLKIEDNIITDILNGIKYNLYFCSSENFYSRLFCETGSNTFIKAFEKEAEKLNISFSKDNFIINNKIIDIKSEDDIFKAINLQSIRPELRENDDIIRMAKSRTITNPILFSDIKGALHIHTTYSDGHDTLEAMIQKAQSLGFKYIGICDHSKSAFYANGLTPERIKEQSKEIDFLQNKYKKIIILKGIESDILKDGSLDYPDDILKSFDFIVASIHSNFKLSYEEMTARLVKAATNRYTTIIGHPTGRLLLSREGFKFDWDKLLKACKTNNTALELNSDEHRLDTPYSIINSAIKEGVKISINSDAHSINSLENIINGVRIINKIPIKKEDILNAFEFEDFEKIIKKY